MKPASLDHLRRRTDFVAASTGKRASSSAFVVQSRERGDGEILKKSPPRIGFTVSKKVGNAVERNRARRRLREVVRLCAADRLSSGTDYVLVARRLTLSLPFAQLTADFLGAIKRLDREQPGLPRGGSRNKSGHDKMGPLPQGAEQGQS